MNHLTLRKANNLLSFIAIVLGLYICLYPFLPAVNWWVRYQAPLVSSAPAVEVPTEGIPSTNTLLIPRLDLRQEIHEGASAVALSRGVWRQPTPGNPVDGGNMVLAGHRFTYSGKSVFYYLDKVQAGDEITLYWESKRYDYIVRDIREVAPTDETVTMQTQDPRLTIYTCTPLWSAKNRLVIEATPKEAL